MNNNDHSNNNNDSDINANHNDINTLTTFFFFVESGNLFHHTKRLIYESLNNI